MQPCFTLRRARPDDAPALRRLHRRSMSALGQAHYTPRQIEGLFLTVETVDPDLIASGRYFVAEAEGMIVGSGGWSDAMPGTGRGDDEAADRPDATIRAVFVHPSFTRRGIARRIMDIAESDAVLRAGADTIGLLATLSGVPLYRALGYDAGTAIALPLANGETFRAVPMIKPLVDPDPVCFEARTAELRVGR